MKIPRVIPVLLIRGDGLVKTVRFGKDRYVGDPINAVKIFNEKEVDELAVLDLSASLENRGPNFGRIADLASECFMPLAIGGGIRSLQEMERIFRTGVEKVILNRSLYSDPHLISEGAKRFGSQAMVASIDVKRDFFGRYRIYTDGGERNCAQDPVTTAKRLSDSGAGEILLQSIDRDGTYGGYDLKLIHDVASAISIPLIACGGARNMTDLVEGVRAGASAVAAGSLFVFHGVHRAVLINFPERQDLEKIFMGL